MHGLFLHYKLKIISVLSMGDETSQSLAMKVVATLATNLYVGSSAYISLTEVPAR